MLNRPIILACTDFSPHSDITLRTADKIRQSTQGKLYVAHVSEIISQLNINTHTLSPSLDQQSLTEIVHKNATDRLADQIKSLEIEAEPIFRLGVPASGILELIKEKKADLLVMGHGGAGAIERLLLGGLTQKMIRKSPVPVWVVKKETKISRIVGLVDDSDCMKDVISASEELSYLLNSSLEIVSVWQDYPMTLTSYASEYAAAYVGVGEAERAGILSKMKKNIQEHLSDESKTKVRVEMTQDPKVAHALVEILNEDHANLAVMGSHGRNFLDRILLGSETKRVLELFEGNIVILPSKDKKDY